jgi:short-subunit dehydrogenase
MRAEKQERHFWVTGASSGIGRELAVLLAEQGHKVIVSSRSKKALSVLASTKPDSFVVMPCDVSDKAELTNIFSTFNITRIDGIFLSAGICEYVDVPSWDIDSIKKVMDVNYFGVVNSCIEALPLLIKSSEERADYKPFIVGISSMSTYVGFPRAEAYGASKAAMAYFLDALRADVQKQVDICVVYPGFVETPLTKSNDFPMPTMVSAEFAAKNIISKLRNRPRKIVFPLRLHFLLKLASKFPALWYGRICPKLSRARL